MKYLVLVIVISFSAFATEEDHAKMFQDHKQKVVSHIDERITQLTSAKACFNSATKPEEMQKCREQLKSGMQEIKTEWKEERKDMRAKRDELREKKRAEKMKLREEKKALKNQ